MSILVPIDLSAPSAIAIELVALLGQALSEDVILLHVAPAPPPLETLAGLYDVAEPLRKAGITARLRTVTGVPSEQIPKEAARRHARWVIMGTRGLLDQNSTAAAVARAMSTPVLAVRPGKTRLSAPFDSLQLLAGPRSQAPIAWELSSVLATTTQAPLHVLKTQPEIPCSSACNSLRIVDIPDINSILKAPSSLTCQHCSMVMVLHN